MLEESGGRYKRLWMEFEVELVDEMALRTFDLHPASDGEGGISGFVDMGVDERIGFALSTLAAAAWQRAREETGIRWLGGTGPRVRMVDESGRWAEFTLPAMPRRRDDGSFDE